MPPRTPNRRMTLGEMPSQKRNGGSGRQSMGPSARAASPAARKSNLPPRGRKSMLPRMDNRENVLNKPPSGIPAPKASSRRRSSIGGRKSIIPPPAPQVKPDPRPISDKAFQQKCINQLMAFLLESGYEYPISQKTLSRPSAKDFSNMVSFLLRLVDPNFQKGSMKFEDEVALNFKCIGYPYTISKTALVAAGSMHTWPTLLAALVWLMEHVKGCEESLRIKEQEEDKPNTLVELESRADKAFFAYLGQSYQAFMANDAQQIEQLESGLADLFESDDGVLQDEVDRITDLNATILDNINRLATESEDLPFYEKKREDYATDLEQFHDLVRQMDVHKDTLEQQVQDRTASLAETNEKLERMNLHIGDLKKTISTQEFSVDDIHAMESELKGLSEAMDRASALHDQRRKTLFASEKELMTVCNSLEVTLAEYNSSLSDIEIDPENAAMIAKFKASLRTDKLEETDQSKILGVDVAKVVNPAIRKLVDNFRNKVQQTKASFQDSLDRIAAAEDACEAAKAKLQIVFDKVDKCKDTLQNEQETHNAKLGVRQREVDAMEGKVAARRDPVALEEQIAAYERQCAELEALRIQHDEDNVSRKIAVQEEIEQAVQLMKDHEDFLRRKRQEVSDYWASKEVHELKVPENVNLE